MDLLIQIRQWDIKDLISIYALFIQEIKFDFFNSFQEFVELLNFIPIHKLVKQTEKDFIKKMKKYCK
jgi:hypothetical protein